MRKRRWPASQPSLAREYPNESDRSRGVLLTRSSTVSSASPDALAVPPRRSSVRAADRVRQPRQSAGAADRRQPELALRVRSGGSRLRLIRLLMAEAAAFACSRPRPAWRSRGGRNACRQLAPTDVRGIDQVTIDGSVLAYTAAGVAICALAFGVIPALLRIAETAGVISARAAPPPSRGPRADGRAG